MQPRSIEPRSITHKDVLKVSKFLFEVLLSRRLRAYHWRANAQTTMEGPESEKSIIGYPVRYLLLPPLVSDADRLLAFTEAPTIIGLDKKSAVKVFTGLLGCETAAQFVLSNDDVNIRFVKLIWLLANSKGVAYEMDKDAGTLLVHDKTATYGIRKNAIVGGPFEGSSVKVDLHSLIYAQSRKRITNPIFLDADRSLQQSVQPKAKDALLALKVLFVRSEWDELVLFRSLVMGTRNGRTKPPRSELADIILQNPHPHIVLREKLVGRYMPPSEFNVVFGKARADYTPSQNARVRMLNKLYSLPFMDK